MKIQRLSQNFTIQDIQQCNLLLAVIEEKKESFIRNGNQTFNLISSFFYGFFSLTDSLPWSGAVYVDAHDVILLIDRSLLSRCGSRNRFGGAIYFYGKNLTIQRTFGVDCQSFNSSGQFIYGCVYYFENTTAAFTKMSQCTVLRCPGEENQRIFFNDQTTRDSCYFEVYRNIPYGISDFMRIEIGGSNFSYNHKFVDASGFNAIDALTISFHHNFFYNLQQTYSSSNGILNIQDGRFSIVEDCNFVNCFVDSSIGSLISASDFDDYVIDLFCFHRLYFINCQGKYLVYHNVLSEPILIDGGIYVYSFSFNPTDINWTP